MRTMMWQFVLLVVILVPAFTLFSFPKYSAMYSQEEALGWAISTGVVWGFMISLSSSLFLGWLRFMQKGVSSKQERKLEIRGNFHEVFEACRESLEQLPQGVKAVKADKGSDVLAARTRFTWTKAICSISMSVSSRGKSSVYVTVKSQPTLALGGMAYDFGVSLMNVEAITAYLADRFTVQAADA